MNLKKKLVLTALIFVISFLILTTFEKFARHSYENEKVELKLNEKNDFLKLNDIKKEVAEIEINDENVSIFVPLKKNEKTSFEVEYFNTSYDGTIKVLNIEDNSVQLSINAQSKVSYVKLISLSILLTVALLLLTSIILTIKNQNKKENL